MKIKIIINLILALIFFSSAPLTVPYTSALDVFGLEVGNASIAQWTIQGGSYTSRREVTSIDQTTFPTTTYVIEEREMGETYRGWYEKTPEELKLWGIQEAEIGVIRFSAGLVEAWYPMQVGDQKYSYATFEFNLYPGIIVNTSLTADVLANEPVILDFDTVIAFKVRYQLRMWVFGMDETDTYYQWVVPYLGAVKYQDAEALGKLTSFAIGGGTITEETYRDVLDDLKLPESVEQIPRYRLYNPYTYHHHYTTDANEYNVLETLGWIQEGPGCYFYNGYYVIDDIETVRYYRLYNPNSFEHHWTTDANEYRVLGTIGWIREGADGYVFATQVSGSEPLYRLYNPNDGLHHWTMDANERTILIGYGFIDEGIACYVFP